MNPKLIATLAALQPKPEASTINTIVKVGVVGIGLYMGYKWLKKRQTNAANSAVTKDAAANSAQLFRGFMNPSGVSWMRNFDGTKRSEILIEAKNVADLAAVQKFYREMFDGADLLEDLRQELNAEDYTKFLNTVNTNKVITKSDGSKSVDPASLVYDVFFVSNKKTALYNSSLWSKQTVEAFSLLPNGSKNNQIAAITVKEFTGASYYKTLQNVGTAAQPVFKTVFIKTTDWTLVKKETYIKGLQEKRYKTIKVDGTKF